LYAFAFAFLGTCPDHGNICRLAQNSVKYVRNSLITYSIYRDFRDEILHVQRIINNSVIPFYKLTIRYRSEHSRQMKNILGYITFGPFCILLAILYCSMQIRCKVMTV
jgi:hypothetical protein